MSHEIDNTTGMNAIAYVGQKPWHGLGQELTIDADLDTWQREAGLLWTAEKATVTYATPDGRVQAFDDRSVLYRSDTNAPLSVVSKKGYKPVQPREVLDFFDKLTRAGGFTMETAGSLHGGKRIWALARCSDGAKVIGQDEVRPFLLLATSYDGTMATTAKFVCERVVCHNTISIALKEEAAATKGSISSCVKVFHSSAFDAAKVHDQLGIVHGAFADFMQDATKLASEQLTQSDAEAITAALIAPMMWNSRTTGQKGDVRESPRFKQIIDLFNGGAIGSDLTGGQSRWQYLNAVTEYVDHHRGKVQDNRINEAWFGTGDRLKTQARELLLA